MEVTVSSILLSLALAALVTCARKAANWVWFRPKQIEKCLRDQGFKGNAYRFLYGDYKEHISAIKEANSKPMDANDNDIAPRVLPFHQYFVHGMCVDLLKKMRLDLSLQLFSFKVGKIITTKLPTRQHDQ